ncbi:MAG: hypothetical protein LBJ59_10475 [Zoogloeaceae bacterium]|jgi:CRISPR-associated endonuclease Csn1|nr:hypothetical protein [Zoogloeaceae bacterium]
MPNGKRNEEARIFKHTDSHGQANGAIVQQVTLKLNMRQKSLVTKKVALADLTLANLDNLVEPHRNKQLYDAIRENMRKKSEDKDNFISWKTFRKPLNPKKPFNKEGTRKKSPVVRTGTVIDKLSGIPIRDGIAKNDSMLRVDVFAKAGKFYLVPVYVHHRVTGLPNRAIVAHKDEEEWTPIDDSFNWCFSLHPNDLVRVTTRKSMTLGYYASVHRGTGNINLWAHDRNQAVGKEGFIEGIGVKTALKLEKFEVDVLGNIYLARPESRCGLA